MRRRSLLVQLAVRTVVAKVKQPTVDALQMNITMEAGLGTGCNLSLAVLNKRVGSRAKKTKLHSVRVWEHAHLNSFLVSCVSIVPASSTHCICRLYTRHKHALIILQTFEDKQANPSPGTYTVATLGQGGPDRCLPRPPNVPLAIFFYTLIFHHQCH